MNAARPPPQKGQAAPGGPPPFVEVIMGDGKYVSKKAGLFIQGGG